VHRAAVDAHGQPLRRYILWSDDIEYTARVLRRERGYLVPSAVAVHETERPHTALEATGDRFYFHVRNTLYMARGSAWAPGEKPSLLYGLAVSVLAYLRRHRFHRHALAVILRGVRDGMTPGAPTPARP
jgi:GT2 family glycosyltransferase